MNQAVDYIEFVLKNPQAADHLLDTAEKQINALSLFPKKHPLAEDRILASWGVRFTQVNNYLAFYIVSDEDQRVTVIRFRGTPAFAAPLNWNSGQTCPNSHSSQSLI